MLSPATPATGTARGAISGLVTGHGKIPCSTRGVLRRRLRPRRLLRICSPHREGRSAYRIGRQIRGPGRYEVVSSSSAPLLAAGPRQLAPAVVTRWPSLPSSRSGASQRSPCPRRRLGPGPPREHRRRNHPETAGGEIPTERCGSKKVRAVSALGSLRRCRPSSWATFPEEFFPAFTTLGGPPWLGICFLSGHAAFVPRARRGQFPPPGCPATTRELRAAMVAG